MEENSPIPMYLPSECGTTGDSYARGTLLLEQEASWARLSASVSGTIGGMILVDADWVHDGWDEDDAYEQV
ncbi:hypothetical protein [Edaphobacter modestus]|uniref:Uncharacterized protein n=1 Tax=Edaphobacter modestus TaxID=388466 RepID=A0A4Q7YYU5_9BACT|nr:hypothetical protein [Edaphobacter modestus]RZU42938.1 hypothetical protein BDD14_4539 [Edaphobacter modestus]